MQRWPKTKGWQIFTGQPGLLPTLLFSRLQLAPSARR
jgi:hypothetical protein